MTRITVDIRDDLYQKIIDGGFRITQIINMLVDNYFKTGTDISHNDVKMINEMTFSEQVNFAAKSCGLDIDSIVANGAPTCDDMAMITSFLVNRGVATTQPSVYKRFMRDNKLG